MENPNEKGCDPADCAGCSGCGGGTADKRTITLTLDDDTEVECAILTSFPVGNKNYIALLPLDEEGQPASGEVYLYTFSISEMGEPQISNIDTDEEYEQAAEAFNQIVKMAQVQDMDAINE